LVLDGAQRLYPRGTTWQEIGLTIHSGNSYRLSQNFRNTKEVTLLVRSLLENIEIDEDSTIPDLEEVEKNGEVPILFTGTYQQQCQYTIQYIQNKIDLKKDSVAFLHPKGYDFFSLLRTTLRNNQLSFVEISTNQEWPKGSQNIALSTMHSAKGLEFDYVFVLELNDEHIKETETFVKQLAMSISRARKNVILCSKPSEDSILRRLLNTKVIQEVEL